jgi:hypothetical protein
MFISNLFNKALFGIGFATGVVSINTKRVKNVVANKLPNQSEEFAKGEKSAQLKFISRSAYKEISRYDNEILSDVELNDIIKDVMSTVKLELSYQGFDKALFRPIQQDLIKQYTAKATQQIQTMSAIEPGTA